MKSYTQQTSSKIPLIEQSFLNRLIPLMPSIAKKIRIGYAVLLFGVAVPLCMLTEAIAPQVVQAYTTRVDLAIDTLPEENYQTLLRRAEAAARAAAQRSFDQDILVTDVSIFVTVQNRGLIAPVLELAVSRQQWRSRPDPQRWAKYFKTTRSLLSLEDNFAAPTLSITLQQPSTNPNNLPTSDK